MKKLIVVLLVLIMSINICACSSGVDAETEGEPEETVNNDDSGKVSVTSLSIGDQIELGTYEQDNNTDNGAEPIKWVVTGYLGSDYIMLLSWYGLDAQPFNTENVEITWENCSLRKWLNEDFYNIAFDEEEKGYILETQLENPNSKYYDFGGGNSTLDKVWIFNEYDANNYINITEMNGGQVETTAYAQSKELDLIDSYWFRTTGDPNGHPAAIVAYHFTNFGQTYSNMDSLQAVRPVIVLPLNEEVKVKSCEKNVIGDSSSEIVHFERDYDPEIGMTKGEVLDSTWGEPDKKNIDEYEWGTEEQWVYKSKGYIYFENGVVTAIQHR